MRKWAKVKDFDADSQSADEKYDPAKQVQTKEGVYFTGRGQQGGSSLKTPQAQRMIAGSGTRGGRYPLGNTSPKSPQKLRG